MEPACSLWGLLQRDLSPNRQIAMTENDGNYIEDKILLRLWLWNTMSSGMRGPIQLQIWKKKTESAK